MYNYTDKETESKYILLTLQNGQKVQVTYRKKKQMLHEKGTRKNVVSPDKHLLKYYP